MRIGVLTQIISTFLIGLFFLFTAVADEKSNGKLIEQNREEICEVKDAQKEQTKEIQINKEATIEIKGEIKAVNQKLDLLIDLVKEKKEKE